MPGCCIVDCKNSSAKGARLFCIPTGDKNKERRKLWLDLINRSDLPARAQICQVHFSDCQFENNRQDGKKLLTPNSYPDLLTKKRKRLTSVEREVESDNLNMTPELNETNEQEVQDEDFLISRADEDIGLHSIDNLNTVGELKQKLKAALRKCKLYEKKLQQKSKTNLEKIFTEDQLHFLETNQCRGSTWSDETITKALKLYMACGVKGYEEIRRQKLPYPSPRTLQHRIRNLKFRPGILEDVFNLLQIKVSIGECAFNIYYFKIALYSTL
ncbi:hypothetical protein Zmor_003741 [Zophobas morio]|uniref:THAP-type domain-containing protein n=1 Tax=Zophobas morio TaxID=2755281 RepID=A0AA38M1X7_9CUCU|nr:hypothetical protein Zmor_003741 [Zophobas morio]